MDLLHLDLETHPVTPDDPAPPPVCLQACVGPEPRLTTTARWSREDAARWGTEPDETSEPVLVDDDPSWRWGSWSVADMLGPAPDDEATEDDDPAEAHRRPRAIDPDLEPILLGRAHLIDWARWAIEETDLLLCGVNLPFDLLVLIEEAKRRGLDLTRGVFAACEEGRLRDTGDSDKLLCIAAGREEHKFGMEAIAYRRLGIQLGDDKHGPGAWRVRYRELERWPGDDRDAWELARVRRVVTPAQFAAAEDGLIEPGDLRPVWTWPYHARRYALSDVVIDRELWRLQRDEAVRLFGKPVVPDEQARAVFHLCLHLQSTTGVVTDYHQACEARASLAGSIERLRAVLVRAGLMKRRQVWSGVGSVAEGALVTAEGRPGETFRFVHRAGAKGEPKDKGRSALLERDDAADPERDGERVVLPLASLRICAETGRGLELSRDMAEVRRRVEATLVGADMFRDADHLTGTGLVKTDREVLELVSGLTDDAGLRALGALSKVEKLKSTYVDQLCREGVVRWRYDPVKDTGRTSASALRFLAPNDEGVLISFKEGTNFQNFPGRDALERAAKQVLEQLGGPEDEEEREAWVTGWARLHDPRRMVVARPGHLFAVHDYKAIELACMARVLNVFNGTPSTLAAVINSGKDPHLWTGVRVHPILWDGETLTYEELVAERKAGERALAEGRTPTDRQRRVLKTRKMCKVVNFGFLGAMGAAKFVLYAWQGYGVRVALDVAKALRNAFLATYPEVRDYFGRIDQLLKRDLPVVQVGTGRVRRGCTYAAACNSYFQGLAADGAAQAAWMLARQAYVGPGPLLGARPLIFEHDAFLVEFLCELAEELQWLEAELERARRTGAANDPGVVDLAERRRALLEQAQALPQSAEVGRLMVAGMSVFLTDRKRPELSVVVGTDGRVSTRWEK